MKITNSSNNLSVSQNFLINENFVENLISQTTINSGDLVVEIGSGKGIITKILTQRASEVVGIEYDKQLTPNLKDKLSIYKNLKIISEDFLKYPLPNKPFKIFANPPFNLSADIINKILKFPNNMIEAYLILQDKTAERFIGGPMYENNQISTLWKPIYDIQIISKIDQKEFKPSPKVNVVFTKFLKRKNLMVDLNNYQLYRDFVIYGYNQWKPTLLEAFGKVFSKEQLKIINKKYDLDNLKPSDLEIEQWIYLFNTYLSFVPKDKKSLVSGFESKLKSKHKNIQKRHRTTV